MIFCFDEIINCKSISFELEESSVDFFLTYCQAIRFPLTFVIILHAFIYYTNSNMTCMDNIDSNNLINIFQQE